MSVVEHYGSEKIVERLLTSIGLERGEPLTLEALGQVDEFHLRGAQSTLELMTLVDLQEGQHVIDLGSGLGGPARKIAFHRKCIVSGVDLTPEFVAAAKELTRLVGLESVVEFRVGDVCTLPFEDATFDVAWTQHTSMNIADKASFYREARRVIKNNGRFAFYDIFAGVGNVAFPVPWASEATISHLATFEETLSLIARAGFKVRTWKEVTEESTAWLETALPGIAANRALSLAVINGPDVVPKFSNLLSNLKEGRVKVAMGTAEAV